MKKNLPKDLKFRYRRLWLFSVLLMCLVSLAPLIIFTYANYYQYEEAYTQELSQQITHCITSIKQTMEYFINERLSALTLLINEKTFQELSPNVRTDRKSGHQKRAIGRYAGKSEQAYRNNKSFKKNAA